MRLAQADPPPAWILIAAEPVTDVDTTASDVLEELDETLNEQGISLVFAELKDPVRRKIERYGLTRTIDPAHFFPTVEAAVAAFRAETGAEWGPAEPAGADPDGGGPDGADPDGAPPDEAGPAGTEPTAADPTART
jgi:anti-anti-sigma regulatory factor